MAIACIVMALALAVIASAPGSASARGFPPYPKTCRLGANPRGPGNCLLDEGILPCAQPGGSCQLRELPGGFAVELGRPVAAPFSISVSPAVVAVGGQVKVTVRTSFPKCQFGGPPRACWGTLTFGGVRTQNQELPLNYSAQFNAPILAFAHSCVVEDNRTAGNGQLSCSAKVLHGFDQPIPGPHYLIVGVGLYTQNPDFSNGVAGWVEKAVELGPGCSSHGAKPCGLHVKIQQLASIRSGLAVHTHPYQFYPVDFRAPKNSSTFACQSGCGDIVVTVTDKTTHQPVSGADVTASLGRIAHVAAGQQSLCGTGPCGTSIRGQTTDANGQIRLTYWAPGVIQATKVKLKVTARLNCSVTACPAKKMQGANSTLLSVKPYLIYEQSWNLDAHAAYLLAEWAHGTKAFTKFLKATPWAEKIVEFSASVLEGAQVQAEAVTKALAAIEVAEPVLGPVVSAIELYNTYTELSERTEILSLFLEATKLSAVGLDCSQPALGSIGQGCNPFEAAAPSPQPTLAFLNQLGNYGTVAPFHVGAGGLLWEYAGWLAAVRHIHARPLGPQHADLKIFEVSHCDQDKGTCDPGYGNVIGSDTVVNPGIQPELYVELSASRSATSPAFAPHSFAIPYDAVIWTETQPKQAKIFGLLGP